MGTVPIPVCGKVSITAFGKGVETKAHIHIQVLMAGIDTGINDPGNAAACVGCPTLNTTNPPGGFLRSRTTAIITASGTFAGWGCQGEHLVFFDVGHTLICHQFGCLLFGHAD